MPGSACVRGSRGAWAGSAQGGGRRAWAGGATLEEACKLLLLNEQQVVFQSATETLFQIIQKILQNPTDEKYQRIRRSAKSFQEKLAPAKGAVRFLRAAGFVEEGEGDVATFVLSKGAPLEAAKLALKAVVKHRFEEETKAKERARMEENEKAAAKLAELKAVSQQNQAKQTAELAAERERIRQGIQIDRDDLERQKDPTQWK